MKKTREQINEDAFAKRLNKLEQYYIENGNLNIPQSHELGSLLSNTRVNAKNNIYNAEQLIKLEKIGFVLDSYKTNFLEMYNKLLEYIKEHDRFPTSKMPIIGNWLHKWIDKDRKNRAKDYEIEKKNELIALYPTASKLFELPMNEYKKKLEKYIKDKDNNLDDTLYGWFYAQKTYFKQGTLTDEKIQCWKDYGIDLADDVSVKERFELVDKIEDYYKKFGNLEIATSYVTEDGFELGNAYHGLRARIKNNRVNSELKEELIKRGLYLDKYKRIKRSDYSAGMKKSKRNKSGYVGVGRTEEHINSKGGIMPSYIYAALTHKAIKHKIGKYEDHESSYLQAAIDRELYIIERNLPHRRNFTDEELLQKLNKNEIEKMGKYLTKHNICDNLKNLISQMN